MGQAQGRVHKGTGGKEPDDGDDVVGQFLEENVENDSCEEKAEQEPKRRVTFEGAAHKEGVQVVSNEACGRKAFVTHFGGVFEAGAEERK